MNASASWTHGRDCARDAPAPSSRLTPGLSGRFGSSFWVMLEGPGKNYKNTRILLVREEGRAGFVWARPRILVGSPELGPGPRTRGDSSFGAPHATAESKIAQLGKA